MKNYLDLDEISLDRSATTLQFAIGVDYSNIFVDDTYILDKDNYQVEPDSYKVVGVSKASSSAIGDFPCNQQNLMLLRLVCLMALLHRWLL